MADARFVPPMTTGLSSQNEGIYCVTQEAYAGETIWACVDIPCSGTWYVMAKSWKGGDGDDSFYLTVGDNPKVVWDIFQCTGPNDKWDRDYVSAAAGDTATCNPETITDPAPFPMQKGTIRISLGGREITDEDSSPAISRILLVTNPDLPFMPE